MLSVRWYGKSPVNRENEQRQSTRSYRIDHNKTLINHCEP